MEIAMTQAVFFDLDGTFADTAPDLAAALNHTRAMRDLPPLPYEMLRPQASHGSPGLLKTGFGITPEAPEFNALREIFLDHYTSHICVGTRLFDGMAQLIDQIEQRGLPWGIITNKPHRYTVPLMEALGYAQRAACLISADTCAHAKPHPEPMLKACEIVGVAPERCLYLGDDLRDMQAANASKMRGIIAHWGYISSDTAEWNAQGGIQTPLELLSWL
jgi:phosphoglycolate phosphatase